MVAGWLIDHVERRAADPCGKTALEAFVASLAFPEKAGRVPQGEGSLLPRRRPDQRRRRSARAGCHAAHCPRGAPPAIRMDQPSSSDAANNANNENEDAPKEDVPFKQVEFASLGPGEALRARAAIWTYSQSHSPEN